VARLSIVLRFRLASQNTAPQVIFSQASSAIFGPGF
jgi:hypothetical protein